MRGGLSGWSRAGPRSLGMNATWRQRTVAVALGLDPPHSSQHLLSPHHGSRHTLLTGWGGLCHHLPLGGGAGLGPLLPPHPHPCGERCVEAHGGIGTTAPLTAGPAEASGTLNPLCKVLCILQSLYLCAIGPTLVFCLARDTPCTSNCSPKPLYSWIQATAPWGPWHTGRRTGQYPSVVGHSRALPGTTGPPGALTCSSAHSIIWIPQ